ncbi:MAG: [protein-PII] uridylyltransferase [Opitutales bacterium]
MPAPDNSLLHRLRKHAQKRLAFDPGVPKTRQLPAYKRFVELENAMLERKHRKGDSGRKVCQARAAMIDVVVENLFLAALDLYTSQYGAIPCKTAIIATGGYGRGELNPHSDIDLMFLYPEKISGQAFETFQALLAEEILYPLWDLGLKVGHASRNSSEALEEARREIRSKNALLESRLICGSEPLFKEMYERFSKAVKKENPKAYILQRLEEEQQRHAKAGNTVYLQEPDIKNGVGGLRDYQNLLWMAHIQAGYTSFREIEKVNLIRRDERRRMERAYDFLLRTRTELHLQNRRPTNQLNLEQQPTIAANLNYPEESIFERVESFMKDYYTAARTIYQTSEMLKERLALSARKDSTPITFREALRAHRHTPAKKVDGFLLRDRVFSIDRENVFEEEPLRLIRIFRLQQQFAAKLDSDLRYLISRSLPLIDHRIINSPSAAKSFCAILRSPGEVYPVLNHMHDLAVLGRYLPEFGGLTCMVQHEYYHRYTADAHVLRTIKHLDEVFLKENERDAPYEEELRKNDDPLLLYLILLLHDIGKTKGVKDHAVNGTHMARPILDRFGINKDQQDQILFIIRNHLEMARFWQRFDLDDPETAASFAEFVGDPEKLRFLYVHTYCDARGTAPTLWNAYKDLMHRSLFNQTMEQFEGKDVVEQRRREHIALLYNEIVENPAEGLSKEEIDAHFSLLPERYFINTEAREITLHLGMVNRLFNLIQSAESVGALAPVVEWYDDIDLSMTVVNVVTWDRAGLFYKLAGALTLAGVNIISSKGISRSDHITIDTFYIIDPEGGVVNRPKAREIFESYLSDSLIHGKELMPEIEALEEKDRQRKPSKDLLQAPFPPSVEVYHELSLKRTIVEVRASDRIGLLYRLARLIFTKGFDISFARVATERGVAMDTFYIENPAPDDPSLEAENLMELRQELETLLHETDE